MGKSQRDKGKRGEREVARLFAEAFPFDFERSWQVRGGGEGKADVQPVGDKPWPLHLEVKRSKRPNIMGAMRQAVSECGDQMPTVLTRKDRCEWLVTMRLNDLFKLMRMVFSGRLPIV